MRVFSETYTNVGWSEARANSLKGGPATRRIIETLAEQHPNADTELHYRNAFELLVATILSAQSTTSGSTWSRLRCSSATRMRALQRRHRPSSKLILSTGFFRQKSMIGMSQKLLAEHGGELTRGHGETDGASGRRAEDRERRAYKCSRRARSPGRSPCPPRIEPDGIAEGEDPVVVEQQLCARLPPGMWTLASMSRSCTAAYLPAEAALRGASGSRRVRLLPHVVAQERPGVATKRTKASATKSTKVATRSQRTLRKEETAALGDA